MDNNISDLLNKVLSNPDMLEKVTTLLPVVSNLMGDGGKKIIETSALPSKPENTEPQNNTAQQPAAAPAPQISLETLIANEEVITAFKNLIIAINNAQNIQPAAVPAFAETRQTPRESDAASASSLGNILGSLFNTSSNSDAKAEAASEPAPSAESADNTANVEKALGALQKFSGIASPEKDERVKLLLALKPFLKGGRQGKVDTAIKYMSAAKILNLFGKNGFV